MERIRHCADLSIRRACGFAMIAIWTATTGLAFAPLLAIKGAAIMLSLMAAILFLKGYQAPKRDFRRTETWILMDKQHGLPPDRAQQVIGTVLQDRYFWHADITLFVAGILWALAIMMGIAG
jgi:hypothetical protein